MKGNFEHFKLGLLLMLKQRKVLCGHVVYNLSSLRPNYIPISFHCLAEVSFGIIKLFMSTYVAYLIDE